MSLEHNSNGCCTGIIVDIDCSDSKDGSSYPENVPKPKDGCAPVNTGARIDEGPGENKEDKFLNYYKDKQVDKSFYKGISKSLDIKESEVAKLTGQDIIKSVIERRKKGFKIEYHHIRPDWAGGKNEGDNLIPIRRKPDHKGEGSAHRWWNRKLEDKNKKIQEEINKCLKKNGISKKIKHNKGESGMKKTAKELKKHNLPMHVCLTECS